MEQNPVLHESPNPWKILPLIARSIIIGFLVSSVGIGTWSIFLILFPMPWCILPMLPALWIYLRFFSGKSRFPKNREWRRFSFRAIKIPARTWKRGLSAALLFVVIVQSLFVVTFRLVKFPSKQFTADYKMLDTMPPWEAWLLLIMSSVVAGICEETGFRGYMQAPIEKKYGPVWGIIITSIVFAAVHLTHSWARPILPQIFFASLLLGLISYRFQTLIFGIIGHSILDVFDYSVWWTNLTGGFRKEPVFITGVDLHFVIWLSVFVVSLAFFFILIDGNLFTTRKPAGL